MMMSGRMFAAMVLLLRIGMRVSAVEEQIINIDQSGCSSVGIGSGFGQSFKTGLTVVSTIQKIEVWLEPAATSSSSYQLKLYPAPGCSGSPYATSLITNVAAGNLGGTAGWYPFSFTDPNAAPLYQNVEYTFTVSRTSTNSGNYRLCGDIFGNGKAYSTSCTAQSGNDIAFRVTIVKAPRILPGRKISLRTRLPINTYVSANNFPNDFDTNAMAANRGAVGQYESFNVEDAGNNKIYLKCVGNNKYCRYDSSRSNELLCDQTSTGASSRFQEFDVGNAASGLKADNGLWVYVNVSNNKNILYASQASVSGPEEAFSVAYVP